MAGFFKSKGEKIYKAAKHNDIRELESLLRNASQEDIHYTKNVSSEYIVVLYFTTF